MSTPSLAFPRPAAPRLRRREAVPAAVVAVIAGAAAALMGPKALALPVVILVVGFFFREPRALLALFLVVGLFKDESFVKSLPIDATVGLGALLIMVCAFRLLAGRVRPVPFGFALTVAIVALSLVASLDWTTGGDYGHHKVTAFMTLTLLAIGAPYFIFETWDDVRRFYTWLVIWSIPVAVLALTHPAVDSGRLAGDNTIGTSRLLCTAALILLLGALGSRARYRLPAAALAAGLIAISAAVGSRGPVLSLALALAVVVAAWVMRDSRKVAPVLGVALVGVAVVPFVSLPASSSARLSEAATNPVEAFRNDDRYVLVQQVKTLIDAHPIRGAGAGAFSAVNPEAKWPHNLFLELWGELGIVAMLAVAATIIGVLIKLFALAWRLPAERPERDLVYILLGAFVFNLLAVQVSGDINDNRDFWGSLAIAWLVAAGRLRTSEPVSR